MSAVRPLERSPNLLASYVRAAGSLLPLAGRLPFVPGHGDSVPEVELRLDAVEPDPERLRRYCEVCAFGYPRATLPATYPHILAFPLHMALMTDGHFPFGAIGLVHVENTITQHAKIAGGETLALSVRATALESHRRGRTFDIVTEGRVRNELVWEERSTMLRRDGASPERVETKTPEPEPPAGRVEWELGGDLGRRYGAVSGDRNPIHMHKYAAKLLGFPRAIAHGMWTQARCLAELEDDLPDAFTVTTRFRKPLLLPRTVSFGKRRRHGNVEFALRSARSPDSVHLDGRIEPTQTPASVPDQRGTL